MPVGFNVAAASLPGPLANPLWTAGHVFPPNAGVSRLTAVEGIRTKSACQRVSTFKSKQSVVPVIAKQVVSTEASLNQVVAAPAMDLCMTKTVSDGDVSGVKYIWARRAKQADGSFPKNRRILDAQKPVLAEAEYRASSQVDAKRPGAVVVALIHVKNVHANPTIGHIRLGSGVNDIGVTP